MSPQAFQTGNKQAGINRRATSRQEIRMEGIVSKCFAALDIFLIASQDTISDIINDRNTITGRLSCQKTE
jgi:hypothetical protein